MSKESKGCIIEKGGKKYARITWTDEHSGKRKEISRVVADKREAAKVLKQLREEVSERRKAQPTESWQTPVGSNLTFDKLADIYKERRLVEPQYVNDRKVKGLRSYRVLLGYLVHLREYFGKRRILSIKPSDIEEYKLSRLNTPKIRGGGSRGIAGVNRELELLRTMFIYAKREGMIEVSPFERGSRLISKADEVRRKRILSTDEETRLFEALRKTIYRRRLIPAVITALDTGMRRGELLSLRWSDLDIEGRTISIRAINTKTLSARDVPMSERLAAALIELKDGRGKPEGESFIFSFADLRKSFNAALSEAKIDGMHWHDMRATAASRLIAGGMPIEEVAKIMGHTVLNTTFAVYTRINEQTVSRAAEIINRVNGAV